MDNELYRLEFDMMSDSTIVRVFHHALISRVSENVVLEMFRDEIQKALTNDADLRILVREMIKEAISRMNVQEVVGEAVKAALQSSTSTQTEKEANGPKE